MELLREMLARPDTRPGWIDLEEQYRTDKDWTQRFELLTEQQDVNTDVNAYAAKMTAILLRRSK